eukprot:gene22114-29173_t
MRSSIITSIKPILREQDHAPVSTPPLGEIRGVQGVGTSQEGDRFQCNSKRYKQSHMQYTQSCNLEHCACEGARAAGTTSNLQWARASSRASPIDPPDEERMGMGRKMFSSASAPDLSPTSLNALRYAEDPATPSLPSQGQYLHPPSHTRFNRMRSLAGAPDQQPDMQADEQGSVQEEGDHLLRPESWEDYAAKHLNDIVVQLDDAEANGDNKKQLQGIVSSLKKGIEMSSQRIKLLESRLATTITESTHNSCVNDYFKLVVAEMGNVNRGVEKQLEQQMRANMILRHQLSRANDRAHELEIYLAQVTFNHEGHAYSDVGECSQS